MCTQIQYHLFDLPSKKPRVTDDSARRSVRARLFLGGLAGNLLFGLFQFGDLPALVSEGQFVAEPLPFANDGFPLGLTFLVELIDILDRSPVCDVARLAFPEEAVEHATTGQ